MFYGVVKPMFTLWRETFIKKGERNEDINSVPPMGYTHTVMSDNQLNRGTLLTPLAQWQSGLLIRV